MSDKNLDAEMDDLPEIWENASILDAEQTKDTRVHLTLRLDANLYRALLRSKKAADERTITATIERVLKRGLRAEKGLDENTPPATLRNLLVHSMYQDALLTVIARYIKPRSKNEREQVVLWLEKLNEIAKSAFPEGFSPLMPLAKRKRPSRVAGSKGKSN